MRCVGIKRVCVCKSGKGLVKRDIEREVLKYMEKYVYV